VSERRCARSRLAKSQGVSTRTAGSGVGSGHAKNRTSGPDRVRTRSPRERGDEAAVRTR
jgi:hypothetical protein